MDSGASTYVTGTKANLTEITESSPIRGVRLWGGKNHAIHSIIATITIDSRAINMTNVLYVPSLKKSLISVGAIADIGWFILFSAKKCYFLDNMSNRQVIALGCRDPRNGLYRLNHVHQVNSIKEEGILWHKQYGHLSQLGLDHLIAHSRVIVQPKV